MENMMAFSGFVAAWPHRMRTNWSALLLPVPVAEMIGLVWSHHMAFWAVPLLALVLALAVAAVLFVPSVAAKIAPLAWFTYGCVGFVVAHTLLRWRTTGWFYGVATAYRASRSMELVLPEAFLIIGASVALLAAAGGPGGKAVRRALLQLVGARSQPRMVPALLLLPVIGLWEETCANPLWFGSKGLGGQLVGLAIAVAGVALVVWRPQFAGVFAVIGMMILGVLFLVYPAEHWSGFISWAHKGPAWDHPGAIFPQLGVYSGLNGPVLMDIEKATSWTKDEGWVLVVAGSMLVPRMLAMVADPVLARRAAALTKRVDRLARTRRDATETAVAELRRIERDLHDGAQARLVAVGALDDLRGLVRGIYPPVLADRGLADAVRTLALDTPMTVETDITLAGAPPMPVAAAVYFGIAEVLTNAVRHAAADTVQIGIGHAGGILRATVTDDGGGGADVSRGTGLAGVERRLATFDGVLAVSSPPGGPTIVVLEVPCELAGTDAARFTHLSWQTTR
jgi:signal transduction histidine kinase